MPSVTADVGMATADRAALHRKLLCIVGGVIVGMVFMCLMLHFVKHDAASARPVSITVVGRKSRRPTILLAGDSITEQGSDPSRNGWACQLQNRYARSADVLQRGVSGYTTKYVSAAAVCVC